MKIEGQKCGFVLDRFNSHSCVSERLYDAALHVLHPEFGREDVKSFPLDVYSYPSHVPVNLDLYSIKSVQKLADQIREEPGMTGNAGIKIYYCQMKDNSVTGNICQKRCFGTLTAAITYKNISKEFRFFRVGCTTNDTLSPDQQEYTVRGKSSGTDKIDLLLGLDIINYFRM